MQQYDRLCKLDLESTLNLLRDAFHKRARKSVVAGQTVNTKSVRLMTFAFKGTVCAHCGVKATHFALERNAGVAKDGPYHLNMWGIDEDGNEVLFTQDHIIPRARKGEDTLENSQTMCSPCNWTKKSQLEWELATPDGTYVSCEGTTNPRQPGFYEVMVRGCLPMFPTFLEFNGECWPKLEELKERDGGGEVCWIKGSKPLTAPPVFDHSAIFRPKL